MSIDRLKRKQKFEYRSNVVSFNGDETILDEVFVRDNMSPVGRRLKRLCDFLLALVLFVCLFVLLGIIWVVIKLVDGGAAIYSQERLGRYGHPFKIYKFRTMHVNAEVKGPQLSAPLESNDDRLTKLGRFLRVHHLDELPQLWNVLKGDMSFVGYRPERKFYIDKIMKQDKRYACLFQSRPGVTSYATLYNGYTDTMDKMLRRLELDLYYLRYRSWWLDMKILWLTFWGIVSGKKL